jgi:tripartite-type tricarboxylate transporter receptor subunit TctC
MRVSPTVVFRRSLLVGVLGLGLALTVQAQTSPPDWPVRPIRIIVPNPAGGTADVLPRMIAEPLAQRLAQPLVVENRPGAAS